MAVVNKIAMPETESRYYDDSELEVYDIRDIPSHVEECWYWYGTGCYEGTGEMLMRSADGWRQDSMSHCSCYGPTDDIGRGAGADLLGLWELNSFENKKMVAGLYAAAGLEQAAEFLRKSASAPGEE